MSQPDTASPEEPAEEAGATPRPLRARLKTLVLWLLGTTAFTLVVAEGGLRVAGIEFPDFWEMDPRRGWRLRAGAEGMYQSEGKAFVRVNSDGMRDREHDVKKPAGTYRIAFLGDSFTEAIQVDASKTYWAEVERQLGSCPALAGRKVEALNFGVSSYGTSNSLLTLEDRGFKYEPDAVVLGFFNGNDQTDNTAALDRIKHRPYYTLKEGKLVLDTSISEVPLPAWQNAWHALLRTSRVAQVANRVRVQRALMKQIREDAERSNATAEPALEDAVFAEPKVPAWQDAWSVTEALVGELNRQSRAHNATFTVAVLSVAVQVDPDPAKRKALAARLGVPDLLYPDRRLLAAGTAGGYPVVLLAPVLEERAVQAHTCFHGFGGPCVGHWNEAGHKLAGETLAKAMCAAMKP